MKLKATLLFLFLLAAPGFPADVNSESLAEGCHQASLKHQEAAAGCLANAAGHVSRASMSDRDIYIEIFGQATDRETARQATLPGDLEKTLQRFIEACQSALDLDACLLESLDNERVQLGRYLDTLEPAWWWDDDVRFALFQIMLNTAEGKKRCESLDPSSQPACMEQLPMIMSRATEEALQDLSDKRMYRASYHAMLRTLEVEDRIETEREQDRKVASIEAATRRMQSFALDGVALSNWIYADRYQPIVPAPFFEPFPATRLLPPVSVDPGPISAAPPPFFCTSRRDGGIVYTDCY
jgi:hypothetical protein